ncbi:hypothetical protein RYZ26_13060 [Terasakiella sp. A23]|uniref:hypothetical protein n=1 Tax=Terasakiella sp. FCG-A23 TaxID=3080561 RepID=UPI0029556023|nr:hypothetical protein [Terasakiella sp. A23]MDV7340528.1 hypothetical protein [Terasakiella sp. A23]
MYFDNKTGLKSKTRNYSGQKNQLRKAFIIYEDRDKWLASDKAQAYDKADAKEMSKWLMPKEAVANTLDILRNNSTNNSIQFEIIELDDWKSDFHNFIKNHSEDSILWPITDGFGLFHGSHVISMAELYGLRCFGCGVQAHVFAQDKFKLTTLCENIGISVPASQLVDNQSIIAQTQRCVFSRYFVKPNSLGNKIGINKHSKCTDHTQALAQARQLQEATFDKILIQEYISGVDLRVTYINTGTGEAPQYGFHLIPFDDEKGLPFISRYDRVSKYHGYTDLRHTDRFSELQVKRLINGIEENLDTFSQHVEIKDYFTFDFRVDENGKAWLVDFNPGAFLFGSDVEGYTEYCFNKNLGSALNNALSKAFYEENALLSQSVA